MESKNLPVYFENLSISWETERRNVNVSDSNPSSSDDTALTSKLELQTHLIRGLRYPTIIKLDKSALLV